MNILAIETSSLVASAAIVSDDIMIAEYTMNYKKTHSQTLLPMIDEICKMTDYDISNIDYIAVSAGPGSFTGLRIGSATAKGLGLALDKPLVHVPTVEAMAYNIYDTQSLICPIMDARRNQVYTGIYQFKKTGSVPFSYVLTALLPQCAVSIDEIAQKCNAYGQEIIFLGDGVPMFSGKLSELMQVPYSFAPAHMNRQRAAAFAMLALTYFQEGKWVAAKDHAPEYLRLSQAEREKAEKLQKGERRVTD